MTPIGLGKIGKRLLPWAKRPCGTNCFEAQAHGLSKIAANELLVKWLRRGHVVRAESHTTGRGAIAFQYFVSDDHRKAWEALPLEQRPNTARKRPHGPDKPKRPPRVVRQKLKPLPKNNRIQLGTWARAPLEGKPVPQKQIVRTQGIALGFDPRYEMSPQAAAEFKGIWGSMKLGEYPE